MVPIRPYTSRHQYVVLHCVRVCGRAGDRLVSVARMVEQFCPKRLQEVPVAVLERGQVHGVESLMIGGGVGTKDKSARCF